MVVDMTGFDSKRDAAADKLQEPVQETKPLEIFCGVDYADGVLAVSVMRRSPDGVAEVLHSEQIELAQPAQKPVEYQMLILGGRWTHCAKHIYDAAADKSIVRALYTTLPQRPWVGLTEEDFSSINQSCLTKLQAATSAESILKKKNT
jgi:hypothetical protein